MTLSSLFSFSDNWTDLAAHHPREFIEEVDRRYDLDQDWKVYIRAIKEGSRADKSFARKGCPIKPGEWIVRPYSRHRIEQVLRAVKSGRLKENGVSE